MMSTQLFTIGYEGMDLQSFMASLEVNGVECILDVRESPFSRRPGFSKEPLSRALEARGIRYVHLKELGTPRPLRQQVKSDGDYGRFFQKMEEYLASQQGGIERAYDYVSRMTCCLMCYEKSSDMCHRKIVAYWICKRSENELEVAHL